MFGKKKRLGLMKFTTMYRTNRRVIVAATLDSRYRVTVEGYDLAVYASATRTFRWLWQAKRYSARMAVKYNAIDFETKKPAIGW